jgi:hypothetical protein
MFGEHFDLNTCGWADGAVGLVPFPPGGGEVLGWGGDSNPPTRRQVLSGVIAPTFESGDRSAVFGGARGRSAVAARRYMAGKPERRRRGLLRLRRGSFGVLRLFRSFLFGRVVLAVHSAGLYQIARPGFAGPPASGASRT